MVMGTEGSTSSNWNAGTECKCSVTSRHEERAESMRGTEEMVNGEVLSTVLQENTEHKKFLQVCEHGVPIPLFWNAVW
jgi:hypothetical protein